jgi:2-dehydro-3-deoxyphosphogluconate aldolase/(4S)-4-hydroxy-2-oxoglutarate aldolase
LISEFLRVGNLIFGRKAQSTELCYFPGVLTPTELSTVLSSGCRTVKIFPIEPIGGLSYFRALAAPFQKFSAHYLPTGGIGESKVSDYLTEEQVVSVGGSWITPKELTQKKDYPAMKRLAQGAKKLLHHGV